MLSTEATTEYLYHCSILLALSSSMILDLLLPSLSLNGSAWVTRMERGVRKMERSGTNHGLLLVLHGILGFGLIRRNRVLASKRGWRVVVSGRSRREAALNGGDRLLIGVDERLVWIRLMLGQ